MPDRQGDRPTAARTRYQGRAAVAAMLGISRDSLAHQLRRHPESIPEPDAWEEQGGGTEVPLWLPGREDAWRAWWATFPGRTGRPRNQTS